MHLDFTEFLWLWINWAVSAQSAMMYVAIFAALVAGIHAQCFPKPVPHPANEVDLCRALLKDVADVDFAACTIARNAQTMNGCAKFEGVDFFTQLWITLTADHKWLESLFKGTNTASGEECVGVNSRIDFVLRSVQIKASTIPATPCPPTSGPALSQYIHQRWDLALTALGNASFCGAGFSSYGSSSLPLDKWGQYVKDLSDGIAVMHEIIATNDAVNCVARTGKLANGFKGILEAGGITSLTQC